MLQNIPRARPRPLPTALSLKKHSQASASGANPVPVNLASKLTAVKSVLSQSRAANSSDSAKIVDKMREGSNRVPEVNLVNQELVENSGPTIPYFRDYEMKEYVDNQSNASSLRSLRGKKLKGMSSLEQEAIES